MAACWCQAHEHSYDTIFVFSNTYYSTTAFQAQERGGDVHNVRKWNWARMHSIRSPHLGVMRNLPSGEHLRAHVLLHVEHVQDVLPHIRSCVMRAKNKYDDVIMFQTAGHMPVVIFDKLLLTI